MCIFCVSFAFFAKISFFFFWAAGGDNVCVVKDRGMWCAGLQIVGFSLRVGATLCAGLAVGGIDVGCWEVGSRLVRHGAS